MRKMKDEDLESNAKKKKDEDFVCSKKMKYENLRAKKNVDNPVV